jgi:DNA processing protein
MAEGIDAAAHRGALQARGITIAVMGTGVDRCYPRGHQPLRERIAEQGAVITALLPGQRIEKFRFLQRNRLIAGLAVAVLVVQARLQSGALTTAQAAADQGKTVFAVPGSIDDPRSKGCHQLIRQGASLTERMEDIYSELPWLLPTPQKGLFARDNQPSRTNKEAASQLDFLRQRIGQDAFDIHQLAHFMQIGYEAALVQTLRWELEGLIHREANGRYVLRLL